MTARLSPTLIARYNVERANQLHMETHIMLENIRCNMAETRMASAARLEASRVALRRAR